MVCRPRQPGRLRPGRHEIGPNCGVGVGDLTHRDGKGTRPREELRIVTVRPCAKECSQAYSRHFLLLGGAETHEMHRHRLPVPSAGIARVLDCIGIDDMLGRVHAIITNQRVLPVLEGAEEGPTSGCGEHVGVNWTRRFHHLGPAGKARGGLHAHDRIRLPPSRIEALMLPGPALWVAHRTPAKGGSLPSATKAALRDSPLSLWA